MSSSLGFWNVSCRSGGCGGIILYILLHISGNIGQTNIDLKVIISFYF